LIVEYIDKERSDQAGSGLAIQHCHFLIECFGVRARLQTANIVLIHFLFLGFFASVLCSGHSGSVAFIDNNCHFQYSNVF